MLVSIALDLLDSPRIRAEILELPKTLNRPARLADIARSLGISVAAVSKALRGHSDIGQETRARVTAKARELSYRADLVATGMATGRTRLVGVVIPTLAHSFFGEVAEGISRIVEPRGYQVILVNSEDRAELECREIETLLSRRVEGFVIATAQAGDRKGVFRKLENMKIPFVCAGRKLSGLDANFVGVDNREVGRLATEHLISKRRRRIAHLGGINVSTARLRREGYQQALRDHGLPLRKEYIAECSDEEGAPHRAMIRLLSLNAPPDGVFCYNDPMAVEAMRAILDAGLRIPEDIALIGTGNVRFSDMLRVPLTTIDQGSRRIGEHAACLLIERMENKNGGPRRSVLLPFQLVLRKST
jgi:LacI family transcriptional regulator